MTAKKMITARIDPVLDAALRRKADEAGVTLTELVEKALAELVDVCPLCGREIDRVP